MRTSWAGSGTATITIPAGSSTPGRGCCRATSWRQHWRPTTSRRCPAWSYGPGWRTWPNSAGPRPAGRRSAPTARVIPGRRRGAARVAPGCRTRDRSWCRSRLARAEATVRPLAGPVRRARRQVGAAGRAAREAGTPAGRRRAAGAPCAPGCREPACLSASRTARHVVVADGTRPAWREGSFAKVLADVPCTGLGALRRRPESRWRRSPADLPGLVALQRELLAAAIACGAAGWRRRLRHLLAAPRRDDRGGGGRHRRRRSWTPPRLPSRGAGRRGRDFVQLWPHRHGTDAMFLALLRRD